MIDLERRISGDWIEAREASTDQYVLTQFFQFDSDRLHDTARSLRPPCGLSYEPEGSRGGEST